MKKYLWMFVLGLFVIGNSTVFADDMTNASAQSAGNPIENSLSEEADSFEPVYSEQLIYAVQLYADWCESCKIMDPEYQRVQEMYPEQRVVFLTFDRTDEETSQQSLEYAKKWGLGDIYQQYDGTGRVLLIDAKTKKVLDIFTKEHSFGHMSVTIGRLLRDVEVNNVKMRLSEEGFGEDILPPEMPADL